MTNNAGAVSGRPEASPAKGRGTAASSGGGGVRSPASKEPCRGSRPEASPAKGRGTAASSSGGGVRSPASKAPCRSGRPEASPAKGRGTAASSGGGGVRSPASKEPCRGGRPFPTAVGTSPACPPFPPDSSIYKYRKSRFRAAEARNRLFCCSPLVSYAVYFFCLNSLACASSRSASSVSPISR